ncbi:MAG: hypothetical protein LBL96_10485 [Clostridiales bacterium]|jgi:hypothetical protein|nr:hypothetical protein [Clostridiales bacterium]
MLIHEFIKVSEIPQSISYRDYPKEYMILISDDFIQKYYDVTLKVEMYFNDLNEKDTGLNYHGITILDSDMAEKLKTELSHFCSPSEDLAKLINLLEQSISEKKYVIHFGI